MTTTMEPLTHSWCDLTATHLEDAAWLQTLNWRNSANKDVAIAAQSGDVAAFTKALSVVVKSAHSLSKKQTSQTLNDLELIWDAADSVVAATELPTLRHCLFGELGDLPAVLFQNVEETPSQQSLLAALWILNLRGHQLDTETLMSLWRWTLQASQGFLQSEDLSNKHGLDKVEVLEAQLLAAVTFAELKGGHKLLKALVKELQKSVLDGTDGDGTPHARVLPSIKPVLLALARLQMISKIRDVKLWNKKSQAQLKFCFDRVASLFSGPEHLAGFSIPQLQMIGELFGYDASSGHQKLFKSWSPQAKSSKPINTSLLPEECHQSDWAEWSCLRSTWSSPVDQCVVKHEAELPALDVVARDIPLFAGTWELEVNVDGKAVAWTDEWVCVCWFSDEEASFLELHQEQQGVTVHRQITLLREESLLLIADAVSAKSAAEIDYRSSLPLASGWKPEFDSATREAALQHEALRVRVFPISLPQGRVNHCDGQLRVDGDAMIVQQCSNSSGMFVATAYDWSKKRAQKPVDWSQLTVAENTEIVPGEIAHGARLRIGKAQWLLYHSLQQPQFPRSVLGYHTNEETVFARVEPNGEVVPIVEVAADQ